jgi:hypothetical protein
MEFVDKILEIDESYSGLSFGELFEWMNWGKIFEF